MAVNVDKQKCTGCGVCVDVCPVNAIAIKDKKAVINDACIDCGACIGQCPVEALSL
jgi:ferredoxin